MGRPKVDTFALGVGVPFVFLLFEMDGSAAEPLPGGKGVDDEWLCVGYK